MNDEVTHAAPDMLGANRVKELLFIFATNFRCKFPLCIFHFTKSVCGVAEKNASRRKTTGKKVSFGLDGIR
jgi:hypothetical protein